MIFHSHVIVVKGMLTNRVFIRKEQTLQLVDRKSYTYKKVFKSDTVFLGA